MTLSERKKKILHSLVDDYIESASPVSSKEIQEKHLSEFSSATIRNELSALESMGYLTQPHTSAGRIPSTKAFRFYVDQLMELTPLSDGEVDVINKQFNNNIGSIRDTMESVVKVLSEITQYPSVAMSGLSADETLKNIKLVRISNETALVIVITNANVLKDATIEIPSSMRDSNLDEASRWLNRMFAEKNLGELKKLEISNLILDKEIERYKNMFERVLAVLKRISDEKREIYSMGRARMLEYPEYNDVEKAKQFLYVLDNNENLTELLRNDNIDLSIKIGKEEYNILPEGCSVITARFGNNIGNAAVIGPVRMDYRKVVSVMDHIGKLIDQILHNQED